VAYGYRYGEVKLSKIEAIKEEYGFGRIKTFDPVNRAPVAISLGPHFIGAALPHPDRKDPITFKAGIHKRFAYKPPRARDGFYQALRTYVAAWCKRKLTPLSPHTDISVITWLENTDYPAYRKKELLEVYESVVSIWEDPSYADCKMFPKDEPHETYKHIRAINSRSDQFKTYVGPTFKCIENELYKHKSFIKHVPVNERPQYIYDMLYEPSANYLPTDYSSFESLFVAELMENCEFVLYDYMTQHLPNHVEFMRLMREVIAGKFKCIYKYFTVHVLATRMSGEMCTSLGNGFTNLMLMNFVCDYIGSTIIGGVVEGDDGLFSIRGKMPVAHDFTEMGMVIKMQATPNLNFASFCGCVFDLDDKINVTNPIEVLLKTAWTTVRWASSKPAKLNDLLKCKALSLQYQYAGNPIIQSYALYLLRITNKNSVITLASAALQAIQSMNQFKFRYRFPKFTRIGDMVTFDNMPIKPVPMNTRNLVSEIYGVPLHIQYELEHFFDSRNIAEPFEFPQLLDYCNEDQKNYYFNYCRLVPQDQLFLQSDFLQQHKQLEEF